MLQETQRRQLDDIVNKMVKGGESDDAIKSVVADFKSKYENINQQQNSTPTPKEGFVSKAAGVLSKIFPGEKIGEGIGTFMAQHNILSGQNLTSDQQKQVAPGPKLGQYAGDVAQIALTVAPGLGEVKVASKATQGVGLLKGALQGAKAGMATGAAFGGAYGAAQGLKEDKNPIGVVISGIAGAATGGVAGGVLGGLTGGISGKIAANKLGVSQQEQALKSIIPTPKELTPTEYQDLLRQGRITPKTITGSAKVIPTNQEIEASQKFGHLLQSSDPVKNSGNILDEISKYDTEVGNYLKQRDIKIWSITKLKNTLLDSIKGVTDVMAPSEARIETLKTNIVDDLLSRLEKKDLHSLWLARKDFDRVIDANINAFGGSPSLKKEIARGVRDATQKYISDNLFNPLYKNSMKTMTQLFNVLDMVDNKAVKEKGMSAISTWIKANPVKASVLKWTGIGLGVAGLGEAGKSLIE